MAVILVVEDDPHIRRFITVNLRVRGHTVLEAISGEDALRLLFRIRPQLLLLDLRLPGISGWDLLELIAPDARFQALPVILATANPLEAPERRSRFPQIADVVRKPMNVQQLIASVDRTLRASVDG